MNGSPNPPTCAASLAWLLQRAGDRVASRRARVPVGAPEPAEPAPVG